MNKNVESIEVTKSFPLAVRFEELSQLENGWYEGQGVAPDANKLKTIAKNCRIYTLIICLCQPLFPHKMEICFWNGAPMAILQLIFILIV